MIEMSSPPLLYPQAPANAKIHAFQVDADSVTLEDLPEGSKLIHLVRHGQAKHNRTCLLTIASFHRGSNLHMDV